MKVKQLKIIVFIISFLVGMLLPTKCVFGQRIHRQNKINPNNLGFVSSLYQYNKQTSDSIYYQKIGSTNFINVFIPIGDSKLAKYEMYVDVGGFSLLRYVSLGTKTNNYIEKDRQNYDSKTGTWVTASMPNYYATVIGSTISFTGTFSLLKFESYGTTAGGLWQFIRDNDESTAVNVSTWKSSSGLLDQVVWNNLTYKQYSVIGTYLGEDPDHAGGTRGWCRYSNTTSTERTFRLFDL